MAIPFLAAEWELFGANMSDSAQQCGNTWEALTSRKGEILSPWKSGFCKGISGSMLKYQSIPSIYYPIESKAMNSHSHWRIVCKLQHNKATRFSRKDFVRLYSLISLNPGVVQWWALFRLSYLLYSFWSFLLLDKSLLLFSLGIAVFKWLTCIYNFGNAIFPGVTQVSSRRSKI